MEKKKTKKGNRVRTVILIILLFAVIALACYFSLRNTIPAPVEGNAAGNFAGNIYNGGMFCEYDGKVYFSNPYDDGALYVMNPDESGMKKLTDSKVSYLLAGGNYLFYYQEDFTSSVGLSRSTKGVCRYTLRNGKIKGLNQKLVFNLQLAGNDLYFLSSSSDGAHFYKQAANGGDPVELSRSEWNFADVTSSGSIYYCGVGGDHKLYRYNPDTDSSALITEVSMYNPVHYGNYIYYMDPTQNYRLCRMTQTGDTIEVLTHDRVDCYNIAGSYIYYQKNSKKSPALMRMGIDGSDPVQVMEGNFTRINVTSRYVYFSAFAGDVPVYHVPVGSTAASHFNAGSAVPLN